MKLEIQAKAYPFVESEIDAIDYDTFRITK